MEYMPYANVICSIMYVMISSRLYLSFAISLLSKYMSKQGMEHSHALKWTIAYIGSTLDVVLCSRRNTAMFEFVGYVV